MSEHVVGLGRAYPDRHHNSPPQPFGHTAGAFAEHALDDVGLLEMRVAGIKDERLTAGELMVEQLREARIPPLGHPRSVSRRRLFLRVVVNIEVLGLQDLEIE